MPLNPGDGGRRQRPVPPERLLCRPRDGEGARVHPHLDRHRGQPPDAVRPAPLSGIDQPAVQRRGVPCQHADGHPAQRVRPGGRGRERPPGRLPGRPGARRVRDYAAHQIFTNAYYDFPNESPWTPYVGGGLGVAITTLHYATQFIRKPDAEYLRIDFEPDWPAAAKRAAAGTLSSLDTTVRQEAFGFQVLAGADYALTEHTSVGVTGRGAQFSHITGEATLGILSAAMRPCKADGVTPIRHHAAIRGHQLPGGNGRPEVPLLTDPGPSDRAVAVCSLTWA